MTPDLAGHLRPPVAASRFVEQLLDQMSDMVCTCDSSGTVTFVNRALRDLLGIPDGADDLAGWDTLRRLYHTDGQELTAAERPMRRTLLGDQVQELELVLCTRDEKRQIVVNGMQYLDDGGQLAAMLLIRDITDQRRAEAELEFAASHDPLTGLPNRRLFVASVVAGLRRGEAESLNTAVLHLDVDQFGTIRTAVGYDLAQRVLVEISRRIERVLRATARPDGGGSSSQSALFRLTRPDDPASWAMTGMARVGHDEFLIMCEQVADEEAVAAVVERINDELITPVLVAGRELSVTVSVGISMTAESSTDPNQLIAQAEVAMLRARRRGGCSHAFHADGIDETERSSAAVEELANALPNEELCLLYQPKVSLFDERIVGVEALLRWMHPERGMVPPLDFIPLAEETGLIVPIGRWVLEEACRQGQRWRAQYPDALTVSVNVSVRQLDTDFAATVARALNDSGFAPELLCIEVTESAVMNDVVGTIAILEAVKALGVSVSVDDFGTGYSSLAYLKRIPADELKVDKSFVDGLGTDPEATAIVAAIVASAHALGLYVVAEGVETTAHVASLVTLGCEHAQGFHYSRPVPADVIDCILVQGGRLGSERVTGEVQQIAAKVLIVDDAADVRQLAQMTLAAFGFEVQEASDGQSALALAKMMRPDCVVLDLNLPDMSGLDVCRALRRNPATRHATIVMLTAEAHPEGKVEAFSLGVDEYVVKPFSPRDLAARVRSAMRQHQSLNASASAARA